MIEVQDIKKSFDGVEVLKGISATFHKGKTNLIIGQSGSGKTVFLKTLLGLFVPDSGHIIYDGVRYNDMNKEQRRKKWVWSFRAVPSLTPRRWRRT